jgi:hypothetical protein
MVVRGRGRRIGFLLRGGDAGLVLIRWWAGLGRRIGGLALIRTKCPASGYERGDGAGSGFGPTRMEIGRGCVCAEGRGGWGRGSERVTLRIGRDGGFAEVVIEGALQTRLVQGAGGLDCARGDRGRSALGLEGG